MKKLLSLLIAVATLTAQSVTFEWNVSPDPLVKGYRLYWGTNAESFTTSRPAGSANFFTVTNSLFAPNVPYFFVLTATNAANVESLPSNMVSWTNTTIPDAPKNFRVVVVTNTAGGTVNTLQK